MKTHEKPHPQYFFVCFVFVFNLKKYFSAELPPPKSNPADHITWTAAGKINL